VSREIVVTGLCRTPIGTFGGALKDIKCVELGRIALLRKILLFQLVAGKIFVPVFDLV
jgi:acetyl-CoA C-acetyltransferase